ncbi:helix-turn-helix domain-containing protein [Bifidobacterium scardovii]|uniref:XRE family transcriptional regulator n=1 Tax=Bifidobacterium scardovii TaxID=158787 RepID=A0A087DIM8_9BIFI|nr:helix-turn-helix transcriptional regulator [Bifidobacterium scardovii]KFI95378.1 XRE family transcriptional regulator [Bifidobacterium scardovii]MBS6947922.1 helix-turn-helix transcriptional regulator [Bifidobacterium scardovii]MDK6348977.1 helix-turn-helix transcriptional regulator [Bifidobacterium scardovii]MDU2422295.1 helix-turn-helix transcriptional regulator [Bifidobacterium scardovii]MDU3735846.1 helix-turn-helix transcriptional regulator [Bifidobacterium scardovii]
MPTERFDDMFDDAVKDPRMAELIHDCMAQMTIGMQLAEARADSGMSMDALARRSGVAKTTILNIEHGDASPTIATLTKLADAMGKRLQTAFV